MATVTGLTAQRMLEIEAASVIDGDVVGGNLILTRHDGTQINAGPVIGPAGPQGPIGLSSIPGEVKLWPDDTLPELATWGRWVWADGMDYLVADHPIAASHIAAQWRTFGGVADPGASRFRVPDLRGLVPAGLDAMPGGTRANRMTRSQAIIIARTTGEETHKLILAELAKHTHVQNPHGHTQVAHNHTMNGGVAFDSNTGVAGSWAAGGALYKSYQTASATPAINNATAVNQDTGSDTPHENVQPTVFVPYIVCLDD